MQAKFNLLHAFDFAGAAAHLWVFKNSTAAKKFTAYYVPTDVQLIQDLKGFASSWVAGVTEFSEYSYISQVNESSCLAIEFAGTNFQLLKAQVDRLETECIIPGSDKLKGSTGYVVKYISGNETVYAVKRSSSTWKTSYPAKYMNLIFKDGELKAAEDDSFAIERGFDFICFDGFAFITNKKQFESVVQFKQGYQNAFSDLLQSPAFSALFTDLSAIADYVGTNSIQLRRMAVIEQKGIYASPGFLVKLQRVSNSRRWGINFDAASSRIVPCAETAKIILQVLLDHRLVSEITNNTYDVPDAVRL
ncbi:TPA: DUF4868 domain-containing protein [Pseudomonas aeruginosa]|nr:DUF4868 domain-containing protein [Pseudomonas aeruginosa]HEP8166862.1 DUF4868 domain-containing protein [Pseudomonas aeruginosa]